METQILEGTLSEIQEQLRHLPCEPDRRLRVVVTEPETKTAPFSIEAPFRPTTFRNGVPLLPHRETAEPLTTEFVKRLIEEMDDEEALRAYQIGR